MGPNDHYELTLDDLSLTKSSENCALVGYADPIGKPTIGYGHTGPEVKIGMQWTQAQADATLLSDMRIAECAVKSYVNIPLTREEYIALCDFIFNVGSGNFDHSTLLSMLNNGNIEGASAQFLRWNMAGGRVLAGLVKRRSAEMAEFLLGADFTVSQKYPNGFTGAASA